MSDTTQRAQRLATAIYLITGFFSDQEPLKWKLRAFSADLATDGVKDKFYLANEILNLFSLAEAAGLVSNQNYEILSQELKKFSGEVKNPLNEIFLTPLTPVEKTLLEPTASESIKDKSPERVVERVEKVQEERLILKDFGAVSVKKNSRQSIIIGLLKRKKEIMIKDVSPLINGCSEKTIQRELLAMVEQGILRKIGEKRWSRYTLA